VIAIIWPAPPTKAEAAESTWAHCWKEVAVAAGTSVGLTLPKDADGKLSHFNLRTAEDVEVAPVNGNKAASGTVVKLREAKGQIVFDKGEVTATSGTKRYLIREDASIQLTAQPGTRVKLVDELLPKSDGKFLLPAGSTLDIELGSNESLPAQVMTNGMLLPDPVVGSPWLETSPFPVVSGGRSVQVRFHAPGQSVNALDTRVFQSCIKYEQDGQKFIGAGVDVVSVRDGIATLAVWIPNDLGHGFMSVWDSVELAVLDTATGLHAHPVPVYIGNPLISGLAALVLTGLIIFVVKRWIGQGTPSSWSWASSLIDEGSGRKSLALFQMGAWTLLVIAGMFYVLAMSGNLLNVSEEMLVLLGLAGVGTVAARWINPTPDKASQTGFASMFFVGDQPDMTRLQMFLFTLLIWIYVAWRILTEQAFPTLGANVLLLMGISSGVYVAAKWAQTAGSSQDLLTEARRLRLTLDTLKEAIAIKGQQIARHESTVTATLDPAGNIHPGKDDENKRANEDLKQAKDDLAKLTINLTKAEKDWKDELESLKTK
jgi:hypothetical protein